MSPGSSVTGSQEGNSASGKTASGRVVLPIWALIWPDRSSTYPGGCPALTATNDLVSGMSRPNRSVTKWSVSLTRNRLRPRQDVRNVVVDLRQRSQVCVRQGHDDGGTKAVSGDVADHKPDRAIGHGDIIEIVAGRKLGRIRGPGNVKTGQSRAGPSATAATGSLRPPAGGLPAPANPASACLRCVMSSTTPS